MLKRTGILGGIHNFIDIEGIHSIVSRFVSVSHGGGSCFIVNPIEKGVSGSVLHPFTRDTQRFEVGSYLRHSIQSTYFSCGRYGGCKLTLIDGR